MKLTFFKQCDCEGEDAFFPSPSITSHAPSAAHPFASVSLTFTCRKCNREWKGEAIETPALILDSKGKKA